jgi:hypothetical protein
MPDHSAGDNVPFVPIIDEMRAREPAYDTRSENAKRNWGGKRPGAGAPKGNLNALKHGRTSKRQAALLEALLEVPEARQAFIDIAKRNRKRRRQAEEGAGVLLLALLEEIAGVMVNQEDNQAHINQEFLAVINTTTAELRLILKKQSRRRRIPIKTGM